MYEKPCRCGANKKNFMIDIGPFYIAECCTKAGYDHMGERVEVKDSNESDTEVKSETPAEKKAKRQNRGGNNK